MTDKNLRYLIRRYPHSLIVNRQDFSIDKAKEGQFIDSSDHSLKGCSYRFSPREHKFKKPIPHSNSVDHSHEERNARTSETRTRSVNVRISVPIKICSFQTATIESPVTPKSQRKPCKQKECFHCLNRNDPTKKKSIRLPYQMAITAKLISRNSPAKTKAGENIRTTASSQSNHLTRARVIREEKQMAPKLDSSLMAASMKLNLDPWQQNMTQESCI